jgi:hypothetical protein
MLAPRSIAVLAIASVTLTACFTGKRAHLTDDTTSTSAGTATTAPPVNDPAIQSVLSRLEVSNSDQFTATYTIITKFGSTPTAATVAQDGASRSITIGHVRYLTAGTGETCELTTAACETGLQDQRVSDVQVTHDFFSASPALRLRQDAATMVSAADPSTKQIADLTATCATVHFTQGDKTYCALDNGLLAQQDTPDLRIDLTSFTLGVDTSLFVAPTTGVALTTLPPIVTVATIADTTTTGGP